MKNLFIILALIFFTFTACKKDDSTYTISGTFYKDCNTPLANATIEFSQHASDPFSHQDPTIGTTTTDANGNFTFSYTARNSYEGSIIVFPIVSGYYPSALIDNIPTNQNIQNFVSINKAKSYRVYKVSCSNPLTSNDTLFIGSTPNNYKFYVGPFNNGFTLDTIQQSIPFSINYNDINSPTIVSKFAWGIGYNNYTGMHIISYNHDRTCGKYNIVTIPIN
jgi:hypothetical protein